MKELGRRHEKAGDTVFEKRCISVGWTDEESKEAHALLRSVLIPANDLAVMISAVTVSLLGIFDARKFQFLLTAYNEHQEELITQRALVGITLVAFHQQDHLALYPEFIAALSLLAESPHALKQLHNIQILLLLSRETVKIDKKMREEIIPQMMKSQQLNKAVYSITDLEDLEDMNPEWKADMEKRGERIRELSELQMEGADTYMTTFCQLKTYPFLFHISLWFYPFDKQVPEVAALFETGQINDKSLINLMLNSPLFCNSDKYSFCLTVNSIPPSQRQALSMQIDVQNDWMKQNLNSAEEQANVICRQYIHDLYRFIKLSTFRKEFNNIFSGNMSICEITFLLTSI